MVRMGQGGQECQLAILTHLSILRPRAKSSRALPLFPLPGGPSGPPLIFSYNHHPNDFVARICQNH